MLPATIDQAIKAKRLAEKAAQLAEVGEGGEILGSQLVGDILGGP